jgi:hypothetical protein
MPQWAQNEKVLCICDQSFFRRNHTIMRYRECYEQK